MLQPMGADQQAFGHVLPRAFARIVQYVRYGWPILALVGLIAVSSYVVMLNTAKEQDRSYVQSTQRLVSQSIRKVIDLNAAVSTEYALWSDAYDKITLNDDQSWMSDNFLSGNLTALSVYNSQQGVRFVSTKGDTATFKAAIGEVVKGLDFRAQNTYIATADTTNIQISPKGLVVMNGGLYALAVQPIRPEKVYERQPKVGEQVDFTLAVNAIDQALIDDMGASFDLPNPRLTMGARPPQATTPIITYPVKGDKGQILAFISWTDPQPGTARLKSSWCWDCSRWW
jgi:sensor domain CHASE-containing protein